MTTVAAGPLEQLAEQLPAWQVPGVQVAAVHEGEVVLATGLGVHGATDPTPVGPRTLFAHGSCGKAYTGLLAATLAEAGSVDLDAPVREHVPDLRLPDPYVEQHVSLRDLLSHRAGLGRHDLLWILDGTLDRPALVGRLPHLPPAAPFRTTMTYSNLGYALAGLALERATGQPFPDLLAAQVLRPLGMQDATADAPAPGSDLARGHVLRDGQAVETPWRLLSGVAPAGQLVTSAEDAARWLQHQVGGSTAVRTTHDVAVGLTVTEAAPGLRLRGYGLGWVAVDHRGRPGVWHSGGVDGFLTMTLVLPDTGTGVTVCSNQHMSGFSLQAVLHLTDRLLGHVAAGFVPPEPPPLPEQPFPGPAPARPLADYAGAFTHPGYGELRVEATPDGLAARLGGSPLRLSHKGFETWSAVYEPLDTAVPLTFVTGPEGTVDQVLAVLDGDVVLRRQP